MKTCQLCDREQLTHWYHEDNICWICECKTCHSPLVVLKAHRKPIKNELEHMLNKSREIFNLETHAFDFNQKKFKDHFHFHVREFHGGLDEPLEHNYF